MRISSENLEGTRRERSSRLLLTGATGFLGSHVANRLLQDGFQITTLARPSAQESAAARVSRILDWHATPAGARRRLSVIAGDLLDPTLGFDAGERCRLLAETDEIIHCASETSFSERRRQHIEDVNVRGLERLLDLAAAGRCAVFHHLSTAFAAGQRQGACFEEISLAPGFHNVYEETKCRGDAIVWERCRAVGIRPLIYRPSIVYGDSVTGRSLLFNAVYYPLRAVVLLRDRYLHDIRERGGERARAAGAWLEPDGATLHLPLRVEADGTGIDLIPVDFFTDAFAATFDAAPDGGIFHLVSARPTPVAEIVRFASRMFGLSGTKAAGPADFERSPRNTVEAAFNLMIDAYRPYMSESRTFSTERSGPILSRKALSCPEFTYEVFERCMAYALAVNWGKPQSSSDLRNCRFTD